MKLKAILMAACVAGMLSVQSASAAMLITEWMYNGADGEFIEFTNLGSTAVDMTGWSFDDNTQTAGSFSLSGFGVVQPRESAILTELDAAAFRTNWGLASTVNVVGLNNQNLGRSDEINLYDAGSSLIDRLTFNDQVSGPRTNNVSGNPLTLAVLGTGASTGNAAGWTLSVAGDGYGSVTALGTNVGNPGKFTLVPEPCAVVLAVLLALGSMRCRS